MNHLPLILVAPLSALLLAACTAPKESPPEDKQPIAEEEVQRELDSSEVLDFSLEEEEEQCLGEICNVEEQDN